MMNLSTPDQWEEVTKDAPSSSGVAPGTPVSHSTPEAYLPSASALLCALGIALVLPNPPFAAFGTDLDSSWQAVLAFARDHRLQWGSDLAFTFGPLGFLFTPGFGGSGLGLRLVASFLLSFTLAAGVCQLAWRVSLGWRLLLLWLLVAVFIALDTLFEIGVVVWGLLCLLESGKRAMVCRWVLGTLVAVLSLWKFSVAILAGATLISVAGWDWLHYRRRAALGLLGGSIVLFLSCWLGLHQRLLGLGPYVLHSLQLSSGYNLAMGLVAPREIRIAGLAAAGLTLLVITLKALRFSDGFRGSRLIIGVWLVFATFLTWKHGFVRTAGFEAFFFGFVAMLCVALEAFPSGSGRVGLVAKSATIAVVLWACAALEWRAPGEVAQRTVGVIARFSRNLRILVCPGPYRRWLNASMAERRAQNQLPTLRKVINGTSVDVFGQSQAFAVLNDWNYKPRPIFQSYCVYTSSLMALNQRFYEGPEAPEFVLVNLSPLDQRPPALEDSGALRTLLTRYEPVEAEGAFILFKRTSAAISKLVLVREGTALPGEPIVLDFPEADNLWMDFSLRPSWWGKVEQFVYQPPELHLRTWQGTPLQKESEYRAPVPMLAAGMLIKPFIKDTLELMDLYTGLSNPAPAAISIEMSSSSRGFYIEPFKYRIFRIDPPLGRSANPALVRLRWPGFRTFPTEFGSGPFPLCLTTIAGKSAVRVQPYGHLTFARPVGATQISGAYGFEEVAYLPGNTDGAEFRIELQEGDGTTRLLHAELLRPKSRPQDQGWHPFTVRVPESAGGQIVLRTLPGPRKDSSWGLTCWADIQIR